MEPSRTRKHELPADTRQQILARLRQDLADTPGIALAYAYGSFIGEEAFDDLDLAVVLDDPNDWRAIGRVAGRVSPSLGGAFEVDVVPLNDATPAFRREVVRHGILLYEATPGAGLEYHVRALSEYMDFQALRRSHGLAP